MYEVFETGKKQDLTPLTMGLMNQAPTGESRMCIYCLLF
jgi:hypothetical protein